MGIKDQQIATDSPKAEVGEIDTRAPFESVKAAVSLFGESAFSPDKPAVRKPKPPPTEAIFAKETQLHLSQKELNKFKEQLKNAEITRVQALGELQKARLSVEDLADKLKIINESKESAIKATETAKLQAKQCEGVSSGGNSENGVAWENELDNTREQYAVIITELDSAKQELRRMKKDFGTSMDAKVSAFHQEAEAKQLTGANTEKVAQLSKEIAAVQESLVHVKLASVQAQQEESKILSEKDASRQTYKLKLEETEKKLVTLKKEFDPELAGNLEVKLAETAAEIGVLQKEVEKVKVSDLDSVTSVTVELDGAREVLQKVAEEESSLKSLMESLKLELDSVKKEHFELKEKEAETESVAANLQIELQKSKAELEAATVGESKVRAACDSLVSTLQQLSSESEHARKEAEAMKKEAEELRKEAESTRFALDEAEKNLQIALRDAEEAKAAEVNAVDQIKFLSEKANAARASTSEHGANITISAEEFESLSRKVEESGTLAEMKVAAAMAQVEAVKASENEAMKRLEATRKEVEEMETATEEALRKAEMAEAARRAVEGELKRWREREQKRAAEAAARILAESQVSSTEASPPRSRPPKSNPNPPERTEVNRKTEKNPALKKSLLPQLSGIFHRKKNQVDGGSPSYLPGEKPASENPNLSATVASSSSGSGGENGSSDTEFGFRRPDFRRGTLAGTVQIYDRHVFLRYKGPEAWPTRVEAAKFDRLPRLLSAAMAACKSDIKKRTRLTLCEEEDGTESSNGDVLIFPDMIRYRRLTHFDVDNFVEEVLVKETEWLPGSAEILTGSYVFVCSHGSRDQRCGVCGPVIVKKFKEEIEKRGLQGQVSVSRCSHIGGHKYAGNVIIFSPSMAGELTGHWYGYVSPDDVPFLLEQHIGKGEVIIHRWRGQMGLTEEEQKRKRAEESAQGNDTTTGPAGCCQGVGNSTCCQNLSRVEKLESHHIGENETKKTIEDSSSRESKCSGSKGDGTRLCGNLGWFGGWEWENRYAAISVAVAVVSVVAYGCYRQLR